MIDPELLAQVRRIQVRTNRMVTDVMAGGYTSVFRGSGIEFDEVREYEEGDDIRSVDWNVTARTGRPHIKKYVEERELTVLFLCDVSGSAAFGSSAGRGGAGRVRTVRDTAAEFCACLALAAARNNDKAGLIAFSDRIEHYVPAKKGSQHVLRLIREVLALEAGARGTDLTQALEYAARVQRKRAVVFVLSDWLCTDYGRALRQLARRHDVIAVRILDRHSRELPAAGLLPLRDLETGATRWVDSSSTRVRDAYAARMRALDRALQDELRRARVDLMDLAPDSSLAEPILAFFRRRELRGAHG